MDCICVIKGEINIDLIKSIQPNHIKLDRVLHIDDLIKLSMVLDNCPIISFGDSFPKDNQFNDKVFQHIYSLSRKVHVNNSHSEANIKPQSEDLNCLSFTTNLNPLKIIMGRYIRHNGIRIFCFQRLYGLVIEKPDMLASTKLMARYVPSGDEIDAGNYIQISIRSKMIIFRLMKMLDLEKLFTSALNIFHNISFRLFITLIDGTVHQSEEFTIQSVSQLG